MIDEAIKRMKETEIHLDQIRGCMVGGAVGDALGYAVEFWEEDEIFETYGKEVSRSMSWTAGPARL